MLRAAARPFQPLVGGAPCALRRSSGSVASAPRNLGCLGGKRSAARPLLSRRSGIVTSSWAGRLPPCSSAATSTEPTGRRWRSRAPRHDAESSADSEDLFEDDEVLRAENPGLDGTLEELDRWAGGIDVQVHIHSSPSSKPFELSEMTVPGDQPPEAPPGWAVRLASVAGLKSNSTGRNQDAFSYTHLVGDWVICIVCDGHGEHGDIIAERASRTIPMLLACQLKGSPLKVEEAIQHACLEAQSDLEHNFMTPQVYSGTTVAMCLFNLETEKAWFAHAGDSRLVLGDLANGQVVFATEEHKAHDENEGNRLRGAGAQVIEKRYDEGEVISRVFIPRTGVPGLAMSRSLGDGCLKSYGVIAEPEVHDISSYWLKCREPIVVAASDGVWDTITVEEAVHTLAARRASSLDVRLGAEVLCRRAQRLWIEEEESYCDDATVIIAAPNQPEIMSSADSDY